ncbi:MAG TPA: SUMF1/EgtB/PvdO family nonheme iron enzyme [Bdellovibrionota bacterium]|nr:SUMF1/EgtB/PvdO family nonheme iron enzyme [Bdellovibrionota bacterium]
MRIARWIAVFSLSAFSLNSLSVVASVPGWTLVDNKHWQKDSTAEETPEQTDAREGTRGACPVGMVEVKGEMRVGSKVAWQEFQQSPLSIEEREARRCSSWISHGGWATKQRPGYPDRCIQFDEDKWRDEERSLPTKPMSFCMDRFEYPNVKGLNPMIMVTWPESKAICESEGKRLCTEEEWNFACEGPEALPYPYGFERDPKTCNIDKEWIPFHGDRMLPRNLDRSGAEMARLWKGLPSGSMPGCKSVFGVYDLTGNVDEWTQSSVPGGRKTILKGGYWGPVRTRCRPSTRSHDEKHAFYQQGFRCCAN